MSNLPSPEILVDLATFGGVAVAAFQLMLTSRAETSEYESQFVARYEHILDKIPADVVIGSARLDATDADTLRWFHRYFMLCDEQIAQRRAGKVGANTWASWREGIRLNLRREPFKVAWSALDARLTEDRLADLRSYYHILISADLWFDPKPPMHHRIGTWWVRRQERGVYLPPPRSIAAARRLTSKV